MSRLTRWQLAVAQAALYFSLTIAAQTGSQVTTSVTVGGNVAENLSLTVADLRRYPAHQVEYVPGNAVEQKTAGLVRRYVGCLLRDVLTAAKASRVRGTEPSVKLCRSWRAICRERQRPQAERNAVPLLAVRKPGVIVTAEIHQRVP